MLTCTDNTIKISISFSRPVGVKQVQYGGLAFQAAIPKSRLRVFRRRKII